MMSSRFKFGCVILGGLTLALATGPALAGTRSAVALTGSDSGTCPVPTPCRTLAYALTQTSPNGEILIKESGGYGPITITQGVTINAPPGIIGFISAPSGDAITVNAGTNDLVIVTGLYLDGLATGTNGVTVNTVGSFSISGSTITGFTGNPINYINSAPSNQKLTIGYSSFYSNAGPLLIKSTGGLQFAGSIRGLSLSSSGVVLDNTSSSVKSSLLFDNSILRYNGGTAITVNSVGAPNFAQVNIDKSELYNLNTGISVTGSSGFVFLNDSMLVNIATLCQTASGGIVKTFSNNAMTYGTRGCTPVTQALE